MLSLRSNLGFGVKRRGNSLLRNKSKVAAWYSALGNRENVPVNLVVDAHSWGEGSSVWTRGQRMIDVIQAELETALPTTGVSSVGGTTYIPCRYSSAGSPTANTYTALLGGFTGGEGTVGFGRRGFNFGTVGHGVRYVYTCTDIDIHWFCNGATSGTLQVSIDGGTTPGVDLFTINTASGTFNTFYKTTISGLSNASHQIDVTCSATGAGGTFFIGMMIYRGNLSKGIRVIDATRSGSLSSDNNTGQSQLALLGGFTAVLIALDVNDYNNQVATATLKSNWATVAGRYRTRLGATTPIFLTTFNAPNNLGARTPDWAALEQAAREVSDADSYMAHLPLSSVFPNAATDGGTTLWAADLLHPRAAGHSLLGRQIAAELRA